MRMRFLIVVAVVGCFFPVRAFAHDDSEWGAAFGNESRRMQHFESARNTLRLNDSVKFKDNRYYDKTFDALKELPVLLKTLQTKPSALSETCAALAMLGDSAAPALPQLRKILANRTLKDRDAALLPLAVLGPEKAAPAIPLVIDMLKFDKDPYVKVGAARTLGILKASSDEAISALSDALLHSGSYKASAEAAVALARIGPAAKAAIPSLIQVMELSNNGNDNTVCRPDEASVALVGIGKDGVPALVEGLTNEVHAVRFYTALALVRLQSVSAEAVEKAMGTWEQAPERKADNYFDTVERLVEAAPEVAAQPLTASMKRVDGPRKRALIRLACRSKARDALEAALPDRDASDCLKR